MSTRRPRLSRRIASRMLDDPTAYAGDTGLGAALSAAATRDAGPASHGEERAAAEFRSVAHPDLVPTPRGTSTMSRIASRIAAVPAAVLGAAGLGDAQDVRPRLVLTRQALLVRQPVRLELLGHQRVELLAVVVTDLTHRLGVQRVLDRLRRLVLRHDTLLLL